MADAPQPSSLTLEPNPFEQSFASNTQEPENESSAGTVEHSITRTLPDAANDQAAQSKIQESENSSPSKAGKPYSHFPLPQMPAMAGFHPSINVVGPGSPRWLPIRQGPFTPSIVGTPTFEGYTNHPRGAAAHLQSSLGQSSKNNKQGECGSQQIPGQHMLLHMNASPMTSQLMDSYSARGSIPMESPGIVGMPLPMDYSLSPVPGQTHPGSQGHAPSQVHPNPQHNLQHSINMHVPNVQLSTQQPSAQLSTSNASTQPGNLGPILPNGGRYRLQQDNSLNDSKAGDPDPQSDTNKRNSSRKRGQDSHDFKSKRQITSHNNMQRSSNDFDIDSHDPEEDKSRGSPLGSDEDKRKQFLERNRLAAIKCRQRKKQWVDQLKHKADSYSVLNEDLQRKNSKLESEVMQLKQFILSVHEMSSLPSNVAAILSYQTASAHIGDTGYNSQSVDKLT